MVRRKGGGGGGPYTWSVWVQVKETELLVCEEEGGPVWVGVEGPIPGVFGCR